MERHREHVRDRDHDLNRDTERGVEGHRKAQVDGCDQRPGRAVAEDRAHEGAVNPRGPAMHGNILPCLP